MRLLDMTTLTLYSFLGKIPDYAILSHRWDDEEVSLQDLESGRGRSMAGYAKIEGCCKQAKSDGWEYCWIDSCCIDKTSSAELSESINSMYQWYKKSQVCYAFLRDVDSGVSLHDKKHTQDGYVHDRYMQFKDSAWFTRGWTLQELLAPSRLVFYDHNWIDIGTKSSLQEVISTVTGIEDFLHCERACVAQKMSWAAGRKTTRVEDEAYCIMGLFGVNMPLLYGEGSNAFMRLQHEIIKISDDESIFAWRSAPCRGGLLAESPQAFKSSRKVRPMPPDRFGGSTTSGPLGPKNPFTMTNRGLHIHMLIFPVFALRGVITHPEISLEGQENKFLSPLICSLDEASDAANVSPELREDLLSSRSSVFVPAVILWQSEDGMYHRTSRGELLSVDLASFELRCFELEHYVAAIKGVKYIRVDGQTLRAPSREMIYVRDHALQQISYASHPHMGEKLSIDIASLLQHGFERNGKGPLDPPWDSKGDPRILFTAALENLEETYTELHFVNSFTRERVILVLGSSTDQNPWIILLALPNYFDISGSLVSDMISQAVVGSDSSNWQTHFNSLNFKTSSDSHDSVKSMFKASEFTGVDRVSRPLNGGMSISASLKRVRQNKTATFVVDIKIDPSGFIRWPAPYRIQSLEQDVQKIVSGMTKSSSRKPHLVRDQ